jgi:hypothetical protein
LFRAAVPVLNIAWLRLVALVIDYRELCSLTHPLLQFCVVWGQELHEEFVLNWVQVFCKIARNVVGRFNVGDSKLALSNTVVDPVEAHITCLGALLLYRICSDADSTGIVTHDDRRGLRVAKICQNVAQTCRVLSTSEESSVFCFPGTGNDARYDAREDVSGTVDM